VIGAVRGERSDRLGTRDRRRGHGAVRFNHLGLTFRTDAPKDGIESVDGSIF
jgi:hypothetical protein